ncbi:MAG: hypothetical protein LBU35_03325 [Holosporales bacterium]|jgi:hypothetical protein|nr:hypothetical protein [Holosporales bacterium]
MERTQVIENVSFFSKKAKPLLSENENLFLNRLIYWSEHKKNYGIRKEGRVWIYNTLDDWAKQLDVSKSSVRRAIFSLKSKAIIDSEYLSTNKRNRTLFYSVNIEKLKAFSGSETRASCTQKTVRRERMSEHMAERMYNNSNNTDINKSNKSKKIEKEVFEDLKESSPKPTEEAAATREDVQTPPERPKPTIVQDMLKIWSEEFPSNKIVLTTRLARYLVAAFKMKFNSSLREWKKYLQLLKTSAYLMGEKFKLFLDWAINFTNVDKLKSGWLGTKEAEVSVDESEIAESAEQHVESVEETEKCKETRRKIIKKLSPAIYNSWFGKVDLTEEEGRVFLKEPENRFLRDYIALNFLDKIGLEFLKSHKQEEPATLTAADRKAENVSSVVSDRARSHESLQLKDLLERRLSLGMFA